MIVSQGLLHLASRSIGGGACLFLGPAAQAVPPGVPFTHQLFNGVIGSLTQQQADGVSGESIYKNPRDRSAFWWPRLPTSTLTFTDGSAWNQSCDAAVAARE